VRTIALVCVGACGAGLATIALQAGNRVAAEAPAIIAPAPEPPLPGARDGADPAPGLVADTVSLEPSTAASEPTAVRARHRRWNGYSYPDPIPTPADWRPPEGPVRIALQAGHWKANEAPSELAGLKDNGTSFQGRPEWEVNLAIARRAAGLLERMGYVVDVLPAVVPPGYKAHLFIAIHADGSADPSASGFRVAFPRRDATGRAAQIAHLIERSYGEETGLRLLPDVTRRMRGYYAFNFRRYEHALDPMTIGVIIETGFLTSRHDRAVIVDDPERAARGIVAAVTAFPVTSPPTTLLAADGA
jgi:N-acetylmuramoyl-L-alanine amidase